MLCLIVAYCILAFELQRLSIDANGDSLTELDMLYEYAPELNMTGLIQIIREFPLCYALLSSHHTGSGMNIKIPSIQLL